MLILVTGFRRQDEGYGRDAVSDDEGDEQSLTADAQRGRWSRKLHYPNREVSQARGVEMRVGGGALKPSVHTEVWSAAHAVTGHRRKCRATGSLSSVFNLGFSGPNHQFTSSANSDMLSAGVPGAP